MWLFHAISWRIKTLAVGFSRPLYPYNGRYYSVSSWFDVPYDSYYCFCWMDDVALCLSFLWGEKSLHKHSVHHKKGIYQLRIWQKIHYQFMVWLYVWFSLFFHYFVFMWLVNISIICWAKFVLFLTASIFKGSTISIGILIFLTSVFIVFVCKSKRNCFWKEKDVTCVTSPKRSPPSPPHCDMTGGPWHKKNLPK